VFKKNTKNAWFIEHNAWIGWMVGKRALKKDQWVACQVKEKEEEKKRKQKKH